MDQAFRFIDPAFRVQLFLRLFLEFVANPDAIGRTALFQRFAGITRDNQEADGKDLHHAQCHDDTEKTEEAVRSANRRFGRHISWSISATSTTADRASGKGACSRDT